MITVEFTNLQAESLVKLLHQLETLLFDDPGLKENEIEAAKMAIQHLTLKVYQNPAAISFGRRGGLKGGKARAAALSPERRVEIARKAAMKRWDKTTNNKT